MKPVRLQSYGRSQFNSRKRVSRETAIDYARALQQLMEKAYVEYQLETSLRDTVLLGKIRAGFAGKWTKYLQHSIDSFEDALQQARMAEAVKGQPTTKHTEVGGTCSEISSSTSLLQRAKASNKENIMPQNANQR